MHNDSHEVLKLDWSLDLTSGMRDAIAYKAALKGYDEFTLFDGNYHHMYARTLAIITSVYLDCIHMIHDDGELLQVYLKKKFSPPQLSMLRRVFNTTTYLPDVCLNDMLVTKQANLMLQVEHSSGVVQARYEGLESYEGPIDDSHVREVAEQASMETSDLCCIAYKVVEVREDEYETPPEFSVVTSKGVEPIDFREMAERCQRDRLYAIRELSKVERYFKRRGR